MEKREFHRGIGRLVVVALLGAAVLCVAACGGGGGSVSTLVTPANPDASAVPAPEFPAGHTWFNVPEAPTLAGLRGKAVLLDFWTLGCINCQHVVPDLKQLEEEFGSALVVIGVHSGKYDREHSDQSIRDAIRKYGVEHPVVNDPEFAIWNLYGAEAWPTTVLIDPDGNIVGYHQGEGVYRVLQPAIAGVIEEFDAQGKVNRDPIALDLESEGAVSAVLSFPSAVLADEANGRLFIADAGNNRVLVSGLDGALQDAVGGGEEGLADGAFEDATFRQPQGLALSEDGGTLYIADTRNHVVRAADLQARTVTTIAGTGEQLTTVPPGEVTCHRAGACVALGIAVAWTDALHRDGWIAPDLDTRPRCRARRGLRREPARGDRRRTAVERDAGAAEWIGDRRDVPVLGRS